MCKRSCMESCAQQPAHERNAAASDAAPKQAERAGCAGTSGQPAAAAAGRPASAEVEKKKRRAADEADGAGELMRRSAAAGEDSARERLKRHRTEMAGRVRIPEMWGQERLLKDWVIDCAVFDRPLAATRGLLTARDALVAECAGPRRPPHGHGSTARPLRVQNGACS